MHATNFLLVITSTSLFFELMLLLLERQDTSGRCVMHVCSISKTRRNRKEKTISRSVLGFFFFGLCLYFSSRGIQIPMSADEDKSLDKGVTEERKELLRVMFTIDDEELVWEEEVGASSDWLELFVDNRLPRNDWYDPFFRRQQRQWPRVSQRGVFGRRQPSPSLSRDAIAITLAAVYSATVTSDADASNPANWTKFSARWRKKKRKKTATKARASLHDGKQLKGKKL